ncbi:MAG: type II secretion system F family protein, partial [Deltaproteobacteria bacterium]|nr:type II secretion system F family protein [Deltaproteobacteria bacterium]
LSQHPKIFSQIYINMVRAGEASGSLDLVLNRLAEFSENQEAIKGRFRAALSYPILMLFVGSLVLFFLIAFIVPNITKIFSEMQQTLPLPTIILIAVSNFLKTFWWLILLALTICIIAGRQFKKTLRGIYLWDEIKLRTPILGPINIMMAMARFGRTLGSLLQSSVPLLSALQIVRNIVNNALIADVIDKAMDEIQTGKTLAAPLGQSRWIPPVTIQMISVGEQSGELEKMLNKIADIYEREVESRGMALIVAFIAISILLPIFEMSQMIK